MYLKMCGLYTHVYYQAFQTTGGYVNVVFYETSVQLDVWPVYMFIDGCVNAFSPTDKRAFENVWSRFIARHFNNQWL